MGDTHFMRILSDTKSPGDENTRRLVLCSGKVAYDLIEARDAAGDKNTQIVRIEQPYPFPADPLIARLRRMVNLAVVIWAQEEPKNNGAWFFVEPFIIQSLAQVDVEPKRARYAGRKAPASPATGVAKRHVTEQGATVADGLGP